MLPMGGRATVATENLFADLEGKILEEGEGAQKINAKVLVGCEDCSRELAFLTKIGDLKENLPVEDLYSDVHLGAKPWDYEKSFLLAQWVVALLAAALHYALTLMDWLVVVMWVPVVAVESDGPIVAEIIKEGQVVDFTYHSECLQGEGVPNIAYRSVPINNKTNLSLPYRSVHGGSESHDAIDGEPGDVAEKVKYTKLTEDVEMSETKRVQAMTVPTSMLCTFDKKDQAKATPLVEAKMDMENEVPKKRVSDERNGGTCCGEKAGGNLAHGAARPFQAPGPRCTRTQHTAETVDAVAEKVKTLQEEARRRTPEILREALGTKLAGNSALKEGRLGEAMCLYNAALQSIDEHVAEVAGSRADVQKELLATAVAVQLNITLTQLRMAECAEELHDPALAQECYRCAVESAEVVLALDPGNPKAIHRWMKASEKVGLHMGSHEGRERG